MATQLGQRTWQELTSQPEAWQRVLGEIRPLDEAKHHPEVVYLGAGITAYLARALEAYTRLVSPFSARSLPSQELFCHPGWTGGPDSLYVVLSRTGDVTDSVRALRAARERRQGRFVSIIGERGGPLVELADRAVELGVFEESVVTTRTFTSMCVAAQAAVRLAGGHSIRSLQRLSEVLEGLISRFDAAFSPLALRRYEDVVVMGTGPYWGLAEAGALSIQEMSSTPAAGRHTLVFLHGHRVTVTGRTLALFFVSDEAKEEELKVLQAVGKMGATTVAVGEETRGVGADCTVSLESGIPEWDRLPLLTVAAQVLGYRMALAKGVDPDNPYGLPKVF